MARPSKLAASSVADLHREIALRERGNMALFRKRARLAAKLDALDTQISALGLKVGRGGNGALPGGKKYKNEMTLVEALAKALKGKTMGVAEAVEAVQKAGYRSTAKNFRVVVNIALINSGKFKRVERGQYTAK